MERGPIGEVKWGPKENRSRKGTGPWHDSTAEALGQCEGLGCTQTH